MAGPEGWPWLCHYPFTVRPSSHHCTSLPWAHSPPGAPLMDRDAISLLGWYNPTSILSLPSDPAPPFIWSLMVLWVFSRQAPSFSDVFISLSVEWERLHLRLRQAGEVLHVTSCRVNRGKPSPWGELSLQREAGLLPPATPQPQQGLCHSPSSCAGEDFLLVETVVCLY